VQESHGGAGLACRHFNTPLDILACVLVIGTQQGHGFAISVG